MTKLFLTGFMQVYFVAINTVFLARENFLGVAFASFAISWLWTVNVKRAAFGTNTDRMVYSLGAMAGALSGLGTVKIILTNSAA